MADQVDWPALTALLGEYRRLSDKMRDARGEHAFERAWDERTAVAARVVALTGSPVETFL